MNTQNKITFSELLADKKIVFGSKLYPSHSEVKEFKEKNKGFELWQGIEDNQRMEIFKEWFSQFVTLTEEKVNEWDDYSSTIINGKYKLGNFYTKETYFPIYNKQTIHLKTSERYSKLEQTPNKLNYMYKNLKQFEKKLHEYFQFLDRELEWETAKKEQENNLEHEALTYAEQTAKDLNTELLTSKRFPKDKYINHEYFRIEFDSDRPKFTFEVRSSNMDKETKLILAKFLMTLPVDKNDSED